MPYTFTDRHLALVKADALVNFTDTEFSLGSRFRNASSKLKQHCDSLPSAEPGTIKITRSYGYIAPYIVHVVVEGIQNDAEQLLNCCQRILSTAATYGWSSIAIPLLPQNEASSDDQKFTRQALLDAIRECSESSDINVFLVVEEKKSIQIDEGLLLRLLVYLETQYKAGFSDKDKTRRPLKPHTSSFQDIDTDDVDFDPDRIQSFTSETPKPEESFHLRLRPEFSFRYDFEPLEEKLGSASCTPCDDPRSDADMDAIYFDRFRNEQQGKIHNGLSSRFHPENDNFDLDESFSQTVIRLIDEHGWTDPQCYSKANVSRAVFNKLKQSALEPWHSNYRPSKSTALALIVALELPLSEAESLLKRAGYALSHSSRADIIVEYFLVNRRYNIDEINEVLFRFDQPLLGSV